VVLHVSLEVEIGELVLLVQLEELSQLGIGVDLATVGLVLKTIGLDVRIDLLAHIRAGHLSANRLAEETSKLVADASGLDETRGLAVAVVTALLGGSLLGGLHLTGDALLKGLEVILHRGEETNELLQLGAELGHLHAKNGGSINGGSRGGRIGNNRGGSHGGSDLNLGLLRRLHLGGRSGGGINNGGNGSSLLISGLSSSNHLAIIQYYSDLLLSYFLVKYIFAINAAR